MALAEHPPIETVRDDLARTIRSSRPECIPHETARRLLAYDRPGHSTLVGVDYDGAKAVFHHEADRYVISVPFGPDGLATGGAKLASFDRGPTLEAWIVKMRYYWAWVHPRYR